MGKGVLEPAQSPASLMEILEPRQLLATVQWINPAGGSWDVASNWSTDAVPGPADDVVINVSGASPTVTIGSNVESVHSITAADPLTISGGGLTVAANSTISGGLTMTGGSLTASGSGVTLTVTGTTTDSGGNLYAGGGATLSLSNLANYTGGSSYSTTLEASGAGSALDLPNVTTWEGAVGCCWDAQVSALSGGEVSLPALTTDKGGATRILAQGTGSVVDLSALTNLISDQGGNYSAIQATQGGQIKESKLTSLSDVLLTIDGTGTQDTAQITSLAGDTLTVTGGSPSFAGLTTINGSDINVSGGVSLTLPGVTEYTGGSSYSTTLEASGAGSALDLPNVTTWEGAVGCCWDAQVSTLSGAKSRCPLSPPIREGRRISWRKGQAVSSTCRH